MKTDKDKPNNLSAALPADWGYYEALKKRLETTNHSRSSYVLALVENDLKGGALPNAMSPRILIDLTEKLCGAPVAEEMAQVVGDRNQPAELSSILLSYISAAAGAGSDVPTLANWRKFLAEARGLARGTTPRRGPRNPQESQGM